MKSTTNEAKYQAITLFRAMYDARDRRDHLYDALATLEKAGLLGSDVYERTHEYARKANADSNVAMMEIQDLGFYAYRDSGLNYMPVLKNADGETIAERYEFVTHAVSASDNKEVQRFCGTATISYHNTVNGSGSLVRADAVVTLEGYSKIASGTVSGFKDIDVLVQSAAHDLIVGAIGFSACQLGYIEYR